MNEKFLGSWGFKNQLLWRGLSGSDDLAWAAICCIDAFYLTNSNQFLNF